MRKKWGPLIGGILIGFIIMAMRYENIADSTALVNKNNVVYEVVSDKIFTGTAQTFYENSNQLRLSAEYKKGLLHGDTTEYYENGKIKTEAEYKKGKLHGKYKVYDEEGNLVEKHKYKDGAIVK